MLPASLRRTDHALANVVDRVVGLTVAVVVDVEAAVAKCWKRGAHALSEGPTYARLDATLADAQVGWGATGLGSSLDAVATLVRDAVTIAVVLWCA